MIKKITKYFVSMLLGLILITNTATANSEIPNSEVPNFLNLEQFDIITKKDSLSFSALIMYRGLRFLDSPSLDRTLSLFMFDVENLLNEVECKALVLNTHHALLVKNISESELVWQELSFTSDCDLQDQLNKLQEESNWKQFSSKTSNGILRQIMRNEGWGEDSIVIIVEKTPVVPIEVFGEEYLMDCENKEKLISMGLPSTSLCLQL